jgi:hypothetical protein
MPANPISVMGVSMTRFSPNLSKSPLETYPYLFYININIFWT